MDSFYELSQDTKRYSSNNICMRPMVPDVSILLENDTKKSIDQERRPDEHLSYNAWKYSQSTSTTPVSKNVGNIEDCHTPMQVSNSILRKQVRFQSPTLQQNVNTQFGENEVFDKNEIFGQPFCIKSGNTNKISEFENIYLANIPNRKLDLSIIEPPVSGGKEVLYNYSKYAQLEKKIDTPVYDILNYKSPVSNKYKELELNCPSNSHVITQSNCKNFAVSECNRGVEHNLLNKTTNTFEDTSQILMSNQNKNNSPYVEKFDCHKPTTISQDTETYNKRYIYEQIPRTFQEIDSSQNSSMVPSAAIVSLNNSEKPDQPTVRDLLKIIQQQNEQLLILQKQVATLIDNQHIQQRVVNNERNIEKSTDKPTTFQVFEQDKFGHENPIISNKFNIDVMTSFEVSIRPQQKSSGLPYDNNYQEARIQEITEVFDGNMNMKDKVNQIGHFNVMGEVKSQTNELSLLLNEPLQVQEGRISPDQSVHVDMHDYSSNSDSESNDSSDLGWTIYNNVMGQVNNILTKANVAKIDEWDAQRVNNDKIRSETMKKVKETTLRHLQSIGVHIPADDSIDSLRTQNSSDGLLYSPTEVSFAVQQLLMKYLPSEHLEKLPNIPQDVQINKHITPTLRRNKNTQKVNLVSRKPEFSFATVQYMKKYNLLASSKDDGNKIVTPQNINPIQNKFLDITALKQQPKLL